MIRAEIILFELGALYQFLLFRLIHLELSIEFQYLCDLLSKVIAYGINIIKPSIEKAIADIMIGAFKGIMFIELVWFDIMILNDKFK